MHDWDVAIGLHFAKRFPERVKAVAFMEGHLRPIGSREHLNEGWRAVFKDLRIDDVGRRMVNKDNFFIETILPAGTQRTLSEGEMNVYREPCLEPRDRKPLWRWPNKIPSARTPADVVEIMDGNGRFLAATELPKLLYAHPGAVISVPTRWQCDRKR